MGLLVCHRGCDGWTGKCKQNYVEFFYFFILFVEGNDIKHLFANYFQNDFLLSKTKKQKNILDNQKLFFILCS